MWHSAHHQNLHDGGNDCFDPGRDRCDDWNRGHGHGHERHHGGGWSDPNCHDGGHGLISFDHNSFLACH
jgi:hypothetical protein